MHTCWAICCARARSGLPACAAAVTGSSANAGAVSAKAAVMKDLPITASPVSWPIANHRGFPLKKQSIVADPRTRSKIIPAASRIPGMPHPLAGAEFVIGVAEPAQLPVISVPEIAFAGRSNAGKSSAINALAQRHRLAFASRTPGRTREINLFRLRSGALVADLPGYGYAAVAKDVKRRWQDLLWLYVTTRPTLAALVLIVDSRHRLKETDCAVLTGFVPSGRPVLILATKADKLKKTEASSALAAIESELCRLFEFPPANVGMQLFSATTRQGVAEAEAIIARWLPP